MKRYILLHGKTYFLLYLFLLYTFFSLFLYKDAIGGDFVYDDLLFSQNQSLRQPQSLFSIWFNSTAPSNMGAGGYRPLAFFTFAFQFIFFGESPVSFHIGNILIHSIVSVLVYQLIVLLFPSKRVGLIASVIFLILPIHEENIAQIKYRDDMLAAGCALLSWIYYIQSQKNYKSFGYYATRSAGWYLFSIFSKELLIVLPLIIILWHEILQCSRKKKEISSIWKWYGGSLLIYSIFRFIAYRSHAFEKDTGIYLLNPLISESTLTRIWTSFAIVYSYVRLSIAPVQLSLTYGYNHFPIVSHPWTDFRCLVGVLIFLLFIGLPIIPAIRRTLFSLGSVIFLVSYIPLSKLFFQAGDIVAERWMYFPSIGIVMMISWVIDRIFFSDQNTKKRPSARAWIGIIVLSLVGIYYVSIIFPRNRIWKNWVTFVDAMVREAPDSAWAHFSAGRIYFYEKNLPRAQYEAEEAQRIYTEFIPIQILLGKIAFTQEDFVVADRLFRGVLQRYPKNRTAVIYHALVLVKEKKFHESLLFLTPYINNAPYDAILRYVASLSFSEMGSKKDASALMQGVHAQDVERTIYHME